MTAPDRFERQLPEIMAALAPARVPDYFDDLLRATARTRQRPAWSSLERWLPMDLALPSAPGRARPLAGLALLGLVALLVIAALLAFVGSRPPRVPPPFGPAANGAMYYTSATGDILSMDPLNGASTAVLAGLKADGVLPSRDGLRIAVTGKVIGGEQLSVADADGKHSHALPGTYANFSEIDWSPNDVQVAIVSEVAGVPSITILEADGSKATALKVGLEVHNFWYLPDGRLAFHGTSITGPKTYGLYVVDPNVAAASRSIVPTSTVDNWLGMSPSQDGTRVVYHKWVDDPIEHGRIHVIDVASGTDTTVLVTGTVPAEEFEDATFSPDGQSILFKRFTPDDKVRLAVVPAAGGAPISIGPAVHFDVSPNALYSPDGRSVIAWYPSLHQLWLLDPTGNAAADRQLTAPVTDVPTWQRLAP